MAGFNYTDFELDMINDLKLLKGKLGHNPSAQEVDKEPRMQKSEVYKRHFGSWLRVMELVKGCSAYYDPDDEDEGLVGKQAKQIKKELSEMEKVPGVAPGIDKALDEIDREVKRRREIEPFWKPTLKLGGKNTEGSKAEPEDSLGFDIAEKKVLSKEELDKVPEESESKRPVAEKVEKPSEKVELSKTTKLTEKTDEKPVQAEEPKKEERPVEKPKPDKKPVVKERMEPPTMEVKLYNLLHYGASLSSGEGAARFVPISKLGSAECWFEKFWGDTLEEKELSRLLMAVPVYEKSLATVSSNGERRAFPDVRQGVYYLVDREVAITAKEIGRTTADLLIPLIYVKEDEEKIIYIHRLEVL